MPRYALTEKKKTFKGVVWNGGICPRNRIFSCGEISSLGHACQVAHPHCHWDMIVRCLTHTATPVVKCTLPARGHGVVARNDPGASDQHYRPDFF